MKTYMFGLAICVPNRRRWREFAGYMRNVTISEGVDRRHLLAGFPWKTIGEGGVIVDVSDPCP